MSDENTSLRKAAILLAALDSKTADEMLEKLEPEQEQRLRLCVVELGDVDPQEQRRVVDDFMRVRPMISEKQPPGVELSALPAEPEPAQPPWAGDEPVEDCPATISKPFHFLHEAETSRLARVLTDERSQTIAMVLSHLPAEQSAAVLARFQAAQQVEVIQCLVDLEESDPEILREVEEALQPRFAEQLSKQRRRVAGLAAVNDILNASEPGVGRQIADNLAARDRKLAARLAPSPTVIPTVIPMVIEFDDLWVIDDDSLAAIFEEAGAELSMLALLGASPRLIDRILRWLPPQEAENVRQKLDHPEPVRLSDVEAARREIADVAQRLHQQGSINLQAGQESLGNKLEAVI
jgi:flagellar motor switch protein FliG